MLAISNNRQTNAKKVKPLEEKEGDSLRDKIEVGDSVSTDKFVCKTPRSLPTGYGRDSSDSRYQRCDIYNDADSNLIWVVNQVSLVSNETVMGKQQFEKWIWYQV